MTQAELAALAQQNTVSGSIGSALTGGAGGGGAWTPANIIYTNPTPAGSLDEIIAQAIAEDRAQRDPMLTGFDKTLAMRRACLDRALTMTNDEVVVAHMPSDPVEYVEAICKMAKELEKFFLSTEV